MRLSEPLDAGLIDRETVQHESTGSPRWDAVTQVSRITPATPERGPKRKGQNSPQILGRSRLLPLSRSPFVTGKYDVGLKASDDNLTRLDPPLKNISISPLSLVAASSAATAQHAQVVPRGARLSCRIVVMRTGTATLALATALLSLAGLAVPARAQTTDVLFLGNSYTYWNDLPDLVEQLALSGGHIVARDQNTPGGNTLGYPQTSGFPHMTHPVSLAKIATGGWDIVILQDQSVLPAHPVGLSDFTIPGVQSLAAAVAASSPGATVLLYQTWGRRDPGQYCYASYCHTSTGFDGMTDALAEGLDECAAVTGADVAPVGRAWQRARELDPALILHFSDGSHPILAGSYLAACVFYAKIFDESPVGLTYTAGLDPALAMLLQTAADDTVFCRVHTTYCTSTPNSTGSAAVISSNEECTVADNAFVLSAGPVPDQFGVFFYGPQQTAVAFGNGTLCISGQIGRLPVVLASGNVMAHLVDFTNPPSPAVTVLPGSTWNFQGWFRDPMGGGAFFDLTDALTITFQ